MALYQTINVAASRDATSLFSSVDKIFSKFTGEVVYVDKEFGSPVGSGSLVSPCDSLVKGLELVGDMGRILVAGGDYDISSETNINRYPCVIQGNTGQFTVGSVNFRGVLVLNDMTKDCHFKDITFISLSSDNALLLFLDYSGNVVFEDCVFQSADRDTVIKFNGNADCVVRFVNCRFNAKSTLDQGAAGSNTVIQFSNCTVPSMHLSFTGYSVDVRNSTVGKCSHGGGHLLFQNVQFDDVVNGEDVLVSTAPSSSDNSLQLYLVNTKGIGYDSFGKINKTGNAVGYHWLVSRSAGVVNVLNDSTDLSISSGGGTVIGLDIIAGSISAANRKGLSIVKNGDVATISLSAADESNGGVVTASEQYFGGHKKFKGGVTIDNVANSSANAHSNTPLAVDLNGRIVERIRKIDTDADGVFSGDIIDGKRSIIIKFTGGVPRNGEESRTGPSLDVAEIVRYWGEVLIDPDSVVEMSRLWMFNDASLNISLYYRIMRIGPSYFVIENNRSDDLFNNATYKLYIEYIPK